MSPVQRDRRGEWCWENESARSNLHGLSGHPDIAIRYRGQRGLSGSFNAPPLRIEEAIFRDLFYKREWNNPIHVKLRGDGEDKRSVTVSRGGGQAEELLIPLSDVEQQATTPRSASRSQP